MTREERIEEMLHHAHERGYYQLVIQKVKEMSQAYPNMTLYDKYELAYTASKKEFYENRDTN